MAAATPRPRPNRTPTRDAARVALDYGEAALGRVTRRSSSFSRDDLAQALTLTAYEHGEIVGTGLAASAAGTLLADPARAVAAGRAWTTPAMLALERALFAGADRLAGAEIPGWDAAARDAALARLDAFAEEEGQDPDPDYANAVRLLLGPARLSALEGPPGAHKSEMIRLLVSAVGAGPIGEGGAVVLALSDRIAAETGSRAGVPGLTIASFLTAQAGAAPPIRPGGLVVLDEAGMVGTRDMADVIAAVEAAGARLILVGDSRQIPPEAAGDPFRALLDRVPTARLTRSWRQRDPRDAAATQALRAGDADEALSSYEARDRIAFRPGRVGVIGSVAKDLAAWLLKDGREPDETGVILTQDRLSAEQANLLTRFALQRQGRLQDEVAVVTQAGPRGFAVGDRVILERTVPGADAAPVWAGTTGTVSRATETALEIETAGKVRRTVTLPLGTEPPPSLDHAYALDLRRAQGIKAHRTFVALTGHTDGPELLVALSRHKRKATLVADARVYPAGLADLIRDATRFPKTALALEARGELAAPRRPKAPKAA